MLLFGNKNRKFYEHEKQKNEKEEEKPSIDEISNRSYSRKSLFVQFENTTTTTKKQPRLI